MTEKKPIIAITTNSENAAEHQISKRDNYGHAVTEAGGTPLYVAAPADVAAIVQQADGLLLSGGGDCDASLFGEEPIEGSKAPDRARDDMELALVRAFAEADKPILGICRGMQMLNIALGGTIYQDVTLAGAPAEHHDQPPYDKPCHTVITDPTSLISRILGLRVNPFYSFTAAKQLTPVNSSHHQVVKEVAEPLMASAYSDDGLIEAIEAPNMLACQWHPELLLEDDAQRAIFEWLVFSAMGEEQPEA